MNSRQLIEEWIDGATICKGSSTVGFVWLLYEGCLDFFAKLVPLISKTRSTASLNAILNEEIGRLLSWGDGFEDGELDRTLERDQELRNTALDYLSSLGALLADKLFVVPIFRTVKGRTELEAAALELRSLVNDARTIIDDTGDDSSDCESDIAAESLDEKVVLDDIAADIKFYNRRLMDLLPSIERTAVAPRDIGEPKMDVGSNLVPFQVSKSAHAYILQIRDRFPKAETKLIERLGEANWQRRVRVREEPQEFSAAVAIETSKSIFIPVSLFHDSGLGTSILAQSVYAPTAVSHSSFRTTATENQLGTYRVPPTPKEVFDAIPFTCEICGHVLRNIKTRVDWKYERLLWILKARESETDIYRIHVFADLKPYICTFSPCPEELRTFPTRQLWADHEFRKHRIEKSWRCYLCPTRFSSPGLWAEHVRQVHDATLSDEQSQKALALAEISEGLSAASQTCPMCMEGGMKTRKEFVTHVAKHMEIIALAALPRDTNSDSGSDVRRSSSSVCSIVEVELIDIPIPVLEIDSAGEPFRKNDLSGPIIRAGPNDVPKDGRRSPSTKDAPLDQVRYGRPAPLDLSLEQNRHIGPPYTYKQLISQAIFEAPSEMLTLEEICDYCRKHYSYFRRKELEKDWKASIRLGLSQKNGFKSRASSSHQKEYWCFDIDRREDLLTDAWGGEEELSPLEIDSFVSPELGNPLANPWSGEEQLSPLEIDTPVSPELRNRPDSASEDIASVSLPEDRWGQIRKNAAERATQRHNESRSKERDGVREPLSGDDEDTSGEETIESRVTRIKGRVAELTGNMEESNVKRGRVVETQDQMERGKGPADISSNAPNTAAACIFPPGTDWMLLKLDHNLEEDQQRSHILSSHANDGANYQELLNTEISPLSGPTCSAKDGPLNTRPSETMAREPPLEGDYTLNLQKQQVRGTQTSQQQTRQLIEEKQVHRKKPGVRSGPMQDLARPMWLMRACDRCRRLHVKCSANDPCVTCLKTHTKCTRSSTVDIRSNRERHNSPPVSPTRLTTEYFAEGPSPSK